MERIELEAMAQRLLDAPGWARVGLTAPILRLREEAAIELAKAATAVDQVDTDEDEHQLGLGL